MGLLALLSAPAGPVSIAGRIFSADVYEFRCGADLADANTGATKGKRAIITLASEFADSFATVADMLKMTITATKDASGPPWFGPSTVYELVTPMLGGAGSWTHTDASFSTSPEQTLVIDDLRVYVDQDIVWRVTFSAATWTCGGTVRQTWGPSDIEMPLTVPFMPANEPFHGDRLKLSAAGAIGPNALIFEWGVAALGSDFDASILVEATGGYRWKEVGGATWQTTPVTVVTLPATGGGCVITATPADYGASGSYGLFVDGYAREYVTVTRTGPHSVDPECQEPTPYAGAARTIYVDSTTKGHDSRSARVGSHPDIECSVKRYVPADHAEMVKRHGAPYTTATAGWACYHETDGVSDLDTPIDSGTTTTTIHSHYDLVELSTVLGTAHSIETMFGDVFYATASHEADRWEVKDFEVVTIFPGACGITPPGNVYPPESDYHTEVSAKRHTISASFPGVEETSLDPDFRQFLTHDTSEHVRYTNYKGHPHWSYTLPFPENNIDTDADLIADAQSIWAIDGAPVDVNYWTKRKRQFLYHPALPRSQNRQTLTDLVWHPTNESWLINWWSTNIQANVASHWWGCPRLRFEDLEPEPHMTYSSAGTALWTATNGTMAFGGSAITVTPTTTAPALELSLGSFTQELRLFPAIAREVTLNWAGATITAVSAYLVSGSGDKTLIATTTGRHFLPESSDSQYAGSWAHDFGAGYITDQGADTEPEGDSAAVLANPERVHAFELLPGRQGAKLRFEFTLSGTGSTFTLDYPKLWSSTDDGEAVTNNAHHGCLIWPDGPGIRYGAWMFWNGTSISNPPSIVNPGFDSALGYWTSSTVDGLCWKRLFMQGIDSDSGLLTEIQSSYDSVEGNTKARADDGTVCALVPGGAHGRLVHMDSLRCIPPLRGFCERARDADVQPTGAWAMESWSYAVEPRRYVSSSWALSVADTAGSTWTALETSLSGWWKSSHRHIVRLNETGFEVRANGNEVAEVRPWDGHFALVRLGQPVGDGPSNLEGWAGQYFRVWAIDQNIQFARSQQSKPPFDWQIQVTAANTDSAPVVAMDRHDRLVLVFQRDSVGVMRSFSADRGVTWTTPASFMATRYHPVVVAEDPFVHGGTSRMIYAAYGYVSGSSGPVKIYLRVQNPDDATPGTEVAVNDGSADVQFEAGGFDIACAKHTSSRWVLTAVKSGDTEPSEWESVDLGVTWKEI